MAARGSERCSEGPQVCPQPEVCPRIVRTEEAMQIVSHLSLSISKEPPERARIEDPRGSGVNLGLQVLIPGFSPRALLSGRLLGSPTPCLGLSLPMCKMVDWT